MGIHGGLCSDSFVSFHQHTPLHDAARRGHTDTAQFLVMKGAKINIKDNDEVSE